MGIASEPTLVCTRGVLGFRRQSDWLENRLRAAAGIGSYIF